MRVYRDRELHLGNCVLTIGAFDGVHRGHQSLIAQMVQSAHAFDVPSVVYTFDPPPRVRMQHATLLTTLDQKLKILSTLQVDYVIVASFTDSYFRRAAEEFIGELQALHPQQVWVGSDFRFGSGRLGSVELLREYFQVRTPSKVIGQDGAVISSTRVRELIAAGSVHEAKMLLGWGEGDKLVHLAPGSA